jgi:hypothetical protein
VVSHSRPGILIHQTEGLAGVARRIAGRGRRALSSTLLYVRRGLSRIRRHLAKPLLVSVQKPLNTTPVGRRLLIAGTVVSAPLTWATRRRLGARIATGAATTVPRHTGFLFLQPTILPGIDEVVSTCQRVYDDHRAALAPPDESGRHSDYLVELLSDRELRAHPELVDFCLQPGLVGTVARYLGTCPLLRRVGLVVSFPAHHLADSRLLHADPEDLTQLKLFINVFEVNHEGGPVRFLPSEVSSRVNRGRRARTRPHRFRHRRWTDGEVFRHAQPDALRSHVGAPGSAVLVDSSRCLHYGSRLRGGVRVVFMAQYLRRQFAYPTTANDLRWHPRAHDPLVGPCLEYRRGQPVRGVPAGDDGAGQDDPASTSTTAVP